MPCQCACSFVVAVFLGAFPATVSAASATDVLNGSDIGTSQWFTSMRTSGLNLSMLKALAGSNGQAQVPADCVEISGIVTFVHGNPYLKGRLPSLRIVSADDRVDNVPRSPFVYQSDKEPPNFYSVLKRDLTYEFSWLDAQGNEERFAVWKVPAGAPKQLRLVFAIDAKVAKISVLAAGQHPK